MLYYFDPIKKGFFFVTNEEDLPSNCNIIKKSLMEELVLALQDPMHYLDIGPNGEPVIAKHLALTLEEIKRIKLKEINDKCDEELELIKDTYPKSEIDSWARQEYEARMFINDNEYDPILLRAISKNRGIPLDVLVSKVIEKANSFAMLAGYTIGIRQKLEDTIEKATTIEAVKLLSWKDGIPNTQ